MSEPKPLPFMKMHGLGNDFVVLDGRVDSVQMSSDLAIAIADRHRGVGCDQIAVIENTDQADILLTFYNADGSISGACGNATRCIARHEMNLRNITQMTIATGRGNLQAVDVGNGMTSVNMGPPQIAWDEIPLAQKMDTLELPIEGAPTATGMGNPHCTFFVSNAAAVDLAVFGPKHEIHPLFPHRTNVQVAEVLSPSRIRMRVWERGAGITLASGSSSCATLVAAARRNLTERKALIELDGGLLEIDWRDDGVWMTGPTSHCFNGTLTQAFLAAL